MVVTADATTGQRIASGATAAGFDCQVHGAVPGGPAASAAAIVVDLDLPGAPDLAGPLRLAHPTALIAAFISRPDRERWEAATAAGYDLIATRGAVTTQLLQALATWTGPPVGERVRLFEADDATGRLGVVFRGDTPVGPIAVYRLGKEMFAVGDVCPHAGASLSEGTISEGVITCPKHGSQFDVRSGARARGPADDPIPAYRLSVQAGTVYLHLDDA